ncbi:glycoside hydrolase family 57 protein [Leptospirillum ferriphilum]|nr:1,4-alpha-glucan branching protein domain-containing protein [Leptospirillum ferriphilum]
MMTYSSRLIWVLHAHLPYVRHPEHPVFLEENWFFEAMIETYLPLVMMMDRLSGEGVHWKLTMTLSPPLLSMMTDELLIERFSDRLRLLCDLAEKEGERTRDSRWESVAGFYRERLGGLHHYWENSLGRNLVARFQNHIRSGNLDGLTCGATHGFLPLLSVVPETVEAQVAVGVQTFSRIMGEKPKGIWVPECAYFDGLDEVLARHGLSYFFMESHGLMYADPTPPSGVYAPMRTPAGLIAFARDPDSSKQIWSQEEGYPGDFDYRDFYRDIGYDLPYDYIRPYLHTDGPRGMTGFKYHRITGKTEDKDIYDPKTARDRAFAHARDFVQRKEVQARQLSASGNWIPTVVCPFDAELFGHWWFEGVDFLEGLFRGAEPSPVIEFTNPSRLLTENHWESEGNPEPSSWGVNGYYEVWLNGSNEWIWPLMTDAGREMVRIARQEKDADGYRKDILNQMARELLLAQSSDWPFLMKTGTAVSYAVRRVKDHLFHFRVLREMLLHGPFRQEILEEIRGKSPLFPDIDFRLFTGMARSSS